MANGISERVARSNTYIWTSLIIRDPQVQTALQRLFFETTGKPLPENRVFRFRFHEHRN